MRKKGQLVLHLMGRQVTDWLVNGNLLVTKRLVE